MWTTGLLRAGIMAERDLLLGGRRGGCLAVTMSIHQLCARAAPPPPTPTPPQTETAKGQEARDAALDLVHRKSD